jgi:uncharacterized protein YndB with AHSA1/START domain
MSQAAKRLHVRQLETAARTALQKGATMSVDHLQLTHVPSVNVGMLIRRPAAEVFEAFADPAVTTRFWFTKSSGRLVTGTNVRWDWEMFGLSTNVSVRKVEDNRRIVFDWGPDGDEPRTVEFRFIPRGDDSTYVRVTESGLRGDGDEIVAHIAASTGGFYQVLCALKALLEHGVVPRCHRRS